MCNKFQDSYKKPQCIFPRHVFMSRALPGAIPHIRCKSSHFLDYRIPPTTDHLLMLHTASIQKQTGLKTIHTSSSRVDWGDIHARAHSRRSFSAALLLKPHAQQQTSCGIPTGIICALAASVVLVINCAKSTTHSQLIEGQDRNSSRLRSQYNNSRLRSQFQMAETPAKHPREKVDNRNQMDKKFVILMRFVKLQNRWDDHKSILTLGSKITSAGSWKKLL